MKTGRSVSEIAIELERQMKSKKDYIADSRKVLVEPRGNNELIMTGVNGGMKLRSTAHAQMADQLKIPKVYYDRLLEQAPDLLATNINHWMTAQPTKRLIRTLDNEVRAVLSESYRPLDNIDLAEAVLPHLQNLEANIVSAEITEHRMYLKAVTDKVQGEVKRGDVIQAGLIISNSEIGAGALRVEEMDYRLVCLNGMIRETAVRQAHLGRSQRGADAIEDAREYFKLETRQADDKAFFLKVRDAVGSMFDDTRFQKRIQQYRDADTVELKEDAAEEVVEVVTKRYGFSEAERGSILKHYIKGDMSSVWGIANAITRAAQDVESYDRSTELEKAGGNVIELPRHAWKDVTFASKA